MATKIQPTHQLHPHQHHQYQQQAEQQQQQQQHRGQQYVDTSTKHQKYHKQPQQKIEQPHFMKPTPHGPIEDQYVPPQPSFAQVTAKTPAADADLFDPNANIERRHETGQDIMKQRQQHDQDVDDMEKKHVGGLVGIPEGNSDIEVKYITLQYIDNFSFHNSFLSYFFLFSRFSLFNFHFFITCVHFHSIFLLFYLGQY